MQNNLLRTSDKKPFLQENIYLKNSITPELIVAFNNIGIVSEKWNLTQKLEHMGTRIDFPRPDNCNLEDYSLALMNRQEYQDIFKQIMKILDNYRPFILKKLRTQRTKIQNIQIEDIYNECTPVLINAIISWLSKPSARKSYNIFTILSNSINHRSPAKIYRLVHGKIPIPMIPRSRAYFDNERYKDPLEHLTYDSQNSIKELQAQEELRLQLTNNLRNSILGKVVIQDTQVQKDAELMMLRDLFDLYYGLSNEGNYIQIKDLSFKQNPGLIFGEKPYKHWRDKIESINKNIFIPFLQKCVLLSKNPSLEFKLRKGSIENDLGLNLQDLCNIGSLLIQLNEIS